MFRVIALLGWTAFVSNLTAIPFELNSNKIYIPVSVNGKGPYSFILDTGSISNVLDTERAKSLGIHAVGHFDVRGAGDGSLPAGIAKNVSLNANNASLPGQEVEVFPINSAINFSEGRMVDGLLGCPFFKQFVVRINYVQREVEFYEPGKFTNPAGGESIPIEIDNGNIFVRASITLPNGKRVSDRFLVDTGWRSAISLSSPFVRGHRLIDPNRTIRATSGVGIGGPVFSAIGRLEALEIGRFTIKLPFSEFSESKEGILGQGDMAGIIGGEVLRRFNVILDYPQNRMILEPNKHFADPYEFDMSGIYLTAAGNDLKLLKVYKIIDGSAASEAQLEEGDLIESVDGQPAVKLTVEQVRQMWKEKGREYRLGIRRGKAAFETKLRLRKLI